MKRIPGMFTKRAPWSPDERKAVTQGTNFDNYSSRSRCCAHCFQSAVLCKPGPCLRCAQDRAYPVREGSWTVVVIPDTQNYLVGKKVSERVLDAMPVFDGMSGAGDESFGRHQAELADDQTRE